MKIFKKILMFLGTIALMIFHGFIIIKDRGFSYSVGSGFIVLHFIWFDVLESWIKNRMPIFYYTIYED
jgi:hypothetical protein